MNTTAHQDTAAATRWRLSLRSLVICVVVSTILAILLFVMVVATGQTFGQRAAEKYPWGSDEWKREVNRLAKMPHEISK